MEYYILPKNPIGEITVLEVQPVDMTGVTVVSLPYSKSHYYKVAGRNKEYRGDKVALAIAMGQATIDDITPA